MAQEPPPWEASAASSEPESPPPAVPKWGISDLTWVQIPASAFLPFASAAYSTDNQGRGRRWPTENGTYFEAPVDLPQGARVIDVGIFYLDNDVSETLYGQFVNCAFSGSPCNVYPQAGVGDPDCLLVGWICSGDAFASPSGTGRHANIAASNVVVDNLNRRYSLNIYCPASGGSTRIGGAVVGYVLQVSPAPLTARFPNDVPTTHPFFRFIEALAAAGITGGCGPGSFCPDAPITRGEMAVFLAVALGLHWSSPLM
jgi:hypothetical protein